MKLSWVLHLIVFHLSVQGLVVEEADSIVLKVSYKEGNVPYIKGIVDNSEVHFKIDIHTNV